MICKRLIVLAAGKGSRLRQSADAHDLPQGLPAEAFEDARHMPKPLFRIAGKPLIIHLLERADRAGFTEATIVCAPEDRFIRGALNAWNETPAGPRMRLHFAVQKAPDGTAGAVEAALTEDPMLPSEHFVICNGDNVPTTATLRLLRSRKGPAMIAFDRKALALPEDRVASFAICRADDEGDLCTLTEKPRPEEITDDALVSMNLFKLPADLTKAMCREASPHPTRGERELPTVVMMMVIQELGVEMVSVKAPVVDVTRLHDVPQAEQTMGIETDRLLFEVCASTPTDVAVAAAGGADRVELCAHLPCGGLTSPEADIRASLASGLPIHALIRPRAGHFCYTDREKDWILDQSQSALTAGASRLVVGATHPDGHLDLPFLERLAATFGPERLVIHRAMDIRPPDPATLATLGICRILTSGGASRAIDGLDKIRSYADFGFRVVAGSGVRPDQIPTWHSLPLEALHASCRAQIPSDLHLFDGTTLPVDLSTIQSFSQLLSA